MLTQDPTPEDYFGDTNWPKYPLTNRPITRMLNRVQKHELSNCSYLPVVRYDKLYYTSGSYLGKFYFYDPESTVLINLGKTRVFASKIDAVYTTLSKKLMLPPCGEYSRRTSYPDY